MFKNLKNRKEALTEELNNLEKIQEQMDKLNVKIGSVIIYDNSPGLVIGYRIDNESGLMFCIVQVDSDRPLKGNDYSEEYDPYTIWVRADKIVEYKNAAQILF